MWGGGDAGHRTIENHVISNNSIGYHLDALSGIPNNITLDNINPLAAAIYEDTGVFFTYISIVNDIITDNISV